MAVPFNIPEDQNEVEVIINQLQSLLVRLQDAVRRSRSIQIQTAARVRPAHGARPRNHTSSANAAGARSIEPEAPSSISQPLQTAIPDLLNNLAWLAAISQEPTTTQLRPPRRRTSSESSCCEDTKKSAAAIVAQDWLVEAKGTVQDTSLSTEEVDGADLPPRDQKFFSVDGLLSKIVPTPVAAPLWTAMICFVGWHLFRAR